MRPWQQPWSAEHLGGRILRPLRHNGQKYSGINILTLWMETMHVGYRSPFWLTFHQIQQWGGMRQEGRTRFDNTTGCACGSILRGLGEAGAIVQGVDLNEHMIQLGRRQ